MALDNQPGTGDPLPEIHLLKSVLQHSPACVILAEAPSGRIIYINEAVRSFRGETDAPLTDITLEQYILSWKEKFPDGRIMKCEEMPLARALIHGEIITNEEVIVELDNGDERWALASAAPIRGDSGDIVAGIVTWLDITDYKEKVSALTRATEEIRILKGILPICAHCKNIRDNRGVWKRIESYIGEHSEVRFSHGVCPECMERFYPGVNEDDEGE